MDKNIAVIWSDLKAASQPFFPNMDAALLPKKLSSTTSSPAFLALTQSFKCGHIHHQIWPSQVPTEIGRADIFISMLHIKKTEDPGYGMLLEH